ncbi:unnamed protein product [Acanthoscelides obtectus]|uniref:Uncharacterized protein n=1 Tax=Acanthoscelides obtectus TaxID=200917 RepID=A0A9P0JKA6_ACAOB|nr:unnamed protein product [Acanthoscelides obtectus]CAK1665825.1 hypothetical protein AOBTE_LOCUS24984 [Acanthoscelides obtectus]
MPYYPDLEWIIGVCSFLGSSPATGFTPRQIFHFFITCCLLIGFPFLTLWNFVDKGGATLQEVVERISNFTTLFHALSKTTVMFFNRKKIKELHKNNQQVVERILHIGIVLYAVGYCYSNLGQALSNEIEDVTQNIYLSKWETLVLDRKSKDFLIFFTRTQKKYALSAAGFIQFDLDLDMFMVLVKSALSYCMFFRTMEQNAASKQ